MAYLTYTTAKGHRYYKIVENYRENGTIKHRILLNIGSEKKLGEMFIELWRQSKQKMANSTPGLDNESEPSTI